MDICPQCGRDTPTLHEGCCEDCRDENQSRLDTHNAEYDYWRAMSDRDRDAAIRRAANLYC